jgi:hypothetical protein
MFSTTYGCDFGPNLIYFTATPGRGTVRSGHRFFAVPFTLSDVTLVATATLQRPNQVALTEDNGFS